MVLYKPQFVFTYAWANQYFPEYQEVPSQDLQSHLFVQVSSLHHCGFIIDALAHCDVSFNSLHWRACQALPGFFLILPSSTNSLKALSSSNWWTHSLCFPSPRVHCPLLPNVHYLEKHWFVYFSLSLSLSPCLFPLYSFSGLFSWRRANSDCVIPSLPQF